MCKVSVFASFISILSCVSYGSKQSYNDGTCEKPIINDKPWLPSDWHAYYDDVTNKSYDTIEQFTRCTGRTAYSVYGKKLTKEVYAQQAKAKKDYLASKAKATEQDSDEYVSDRQGNRIVKSYELDASERQALGLAKQPAK